MPPRRLALLACALMLGLTGPAAPAHAQVGGTTVIPSIGDEGQSLDGGTAPTTPADGTGLPGGADGGSTNGSVLPTSPAPDDGSIPGAVIPGATPPPAAPAATTATGVVPQPPAYLAPGQGAQVQPITAVATLTDPDVPFEPVRIAAMIAALLAILALTTAAVIRALGVRSSATVGAPVTNAPDSLLARARERTSLLADDVRDFLRHSR